MAGIISSKDVKLIYCGLKVLVITSDSEQILDIPPPPAPAASGGTTESSNGVNGDKVSGAGPGPGHGHDMASVSISCACVSPAGDMIAVCDDNKQVGRLAPAPH